VPSWHNFITNKSYQAEVTSLQMTLSVSNNNDFSNKTI